ncbi:MAG: ATP-binding protein, partial [Pseudomonadota bacterium]
FSVLSAGWLIYVYVHSFVFPPEATAPITIVNEQRLLQALYALTLAAFVSSVVSSALENAVTAMDQAVKDASRSLRVKEDFLATMSHELRTPLNGVIGLTEALLARGPGPLNGEQGDMLGHVRGSGEHLLALLNDILDLSKIEAGKIRIDPRPYAVEELVEGTRDTYREAAHAKGIDLQIHINADVPPTVLIDDLRLRQVLNNLVSNGIKFTDTGSVTLTAERAPDGKLLFRVIDTGQGIPEDRQKGIFDPFDQGEHNTVRNFGGTGLGLPISQQLCELMDGSLKLESSAPGQTIFCVSLPCHPAELEENGPQRRGLISGGLEGLRVLVAEDNPVNRLVMRNFLKAWGAQAVFAEDGIEALEMFTSADFDIVLVDRQMPRLDGDGVVKAIRRGTEHPDVPIIAVTADAMASDREHMLGIGVDEYISKPLKPQSLKSAICRLIASPPDDPNEDVGDAAGGSLDPAAIEG